MATLGRRRGELGNRLAVPSDYHLFAAFDGTD